MVDQGAGALQFRLIPADLCQHLSNFRVVVFLAVVDGPEDIEHDQLGTETTKLLDERIHVVVTGDFEICLVAPGVDKHPAFELRIFSATANQLLDSPLS